MSDHAKEQSPDLPPHNLALQESVSDAPPAAVPEQSVGLQLAQRRQELGWTVEHVAGRLNLAPRQIDALEADNLAALPGLASTRGFVRAYAKLLRLDAAPLVAALAQEAGPQEDAIPLRRPISTTPFAPVKLAPMKRGSGSNWIWALLALGLVVLVAAGAWQAGLLKVGPEATTAASTPASTPASSSATAPAASAAAGTEASTAAAGNSSTPATAATTPAASVPGDATQTTAPAAAAATNPASAAAAPGAPASPASGAAPNSANTAQPAAANPTSAAASPAAASPEPAKPAATARTLVIKTREVCWIEIKRGDKPSVTRTLQAGSTETIDGTGGVSVLVGNVPGVDVMLDGKPLDLRARARNNVARVDLK